MGKKTQLKNIGHSRGARWAAVGFCAIAALPAAAAGQNGPSDSLGMGQMVTANPDLVRQLFQMFGDWPVDTPEARAAWAKPLDFPSGAQGRAKPNRLAAHKGPKSRTLEAQTGRPRRTEPARSASQMAPALVDGARNKPADAPPPPAVSGNPNPERDGEGIEHGLPAPKTPY